MMAGNFRSRKGMRFPNGIPRTTDIDTGGISDKPPLPNIDLRDRIAAALYEDGQRPMNTAVRLADAVIAELGLREERTETETLTNEQGATWFRQGGYRYVTEWQGR